jgi:hypothetical protein
MAIDKVVSASITDSSVTSAKVASGVLQPNFRNIIINGDMNISQRATSTSSITGNGYHTIDRYTTSASSVGTWTQSQSTTVPSGQGFASSLKMDCTTANGSLSSGSNLLIQQKIEGQNLQYIKKGTSSAESLTLSFWVRSNKTGTYIAELFDEDNTRQYSQSYTISSADTWEKKTITYAGDTTGTLGNDNAQSMRVNFWLSAGSNFTSGSLGTSWSANSNGIRAVGQVNLADSTDNEWYITGIQLEVGTSASDFEFLPRDVNTTRCQRYYQKSYDLGTAPGTATDSGAGWNGSSGDSGGNAAFIPPFKTTMRAAPTVTGYARDGTSGEGSYFRNGASGNGTLAAHMYGQNSVSIYVGTGSAWSTSTIAAHYVLSAEL